MAAIAVKKILWDQIAEVRYRNEQRNSTKLDQRMEYSEAKGAREHREARDRYQKKVLEIAHKQMHKKSDAHLETKLRSVIKKNMATPDLSLLKINLRPWELRRQKNELLRLMDIKQRQFYLKKRAFKHPMHHAYRLDKGMLLGILRKRI